MMKLPWVSRARHEREIALLEKARVQMIEWYVRQVRETRAAQKGLRRLQEKNRRKAATEFNPLAHEQTK